MTDLTDMSSSERMGLYRQDFPVAYGRGIGVDLLSIDLDSIRKELGLDLSISFSEGRVSVEAQDPAQVQRMLLARNDSVGTAVKYGIVGEKVTQRALVAERGQHITVEPRLSALGEDRRFSPTRLLVYPF